MPEFVKNVEEIRQRAIRNIEDGAVTDAYELDKDRTIAILNEALATEIVCVLRYMHHYFMATGVHGKSVANEFKEHADAEREHADEIAERIQQLGGKPDFNPGSLVGRSVSQYVEGESLSDMIREDLIAERVVIEVYSNMIRYFGEKDPTTRIMIEHILQEEEEHASDLADLLFIVDPRTGEERGEDPGTHPLDKNASATGRGQSARNERRPPRAASGPQQPLPGDEGKVEPFAGRGTAVPLNASGAESRAETRDTGTADSGDEEINAEAEHQRGATGRPNRQRPQQTTEAEEEGSEDNAQMGATRAVRITRPNRKKRIA